jgi:ABC-type lipoprotein export system ATPase subunit
MNETSGLKTAQTSIEAINLSKVYWDGDRNLEIFKGISFCVRAGQGVAILGPSGSGKTTLLNLLSGLDRPTEGVVKLGGVDLGLLNEDGRADLRNKKIGFIFQFYHLLPELTALENVFLPAMIGRGKASFSMGRASELLERVGLKDRMTHFPSELSGGEQQRVAIARALMNDPEILFCDEPTGNLDARMGFEIAELLRDLFAREKKTVLIVTHDERIAKMTDSIWSMEAKDWRKS